MGSPSISLVLSLENSLARVQCNKHWSLLLWQSADLNPTAHFSTVSCLCSKLFHCAQCPLRNLTLLHCPHNRSHSNSLIPSLQMRYFLFRGTNLKCFSTLLPYKGWGDCFAEITAWHLPLLNATFSVVLRCSKRQQYLTHSFLSAFSGQPLFRLSLCAHRCSSYMAPSGFPLFACGFFFFLIFFADSDWFSYKNTVSPWD